MPLLPCNSIFIASFNTESSLVAGLLLLLVDELFCFFSRRKSDIIWLFSEFSEFVQLAIMLFSVMLHIDVLSKSSHLLPPPSPFFLLVTIEVVENEVFLRFFQFIIINEVWKNLLPFLIIIKNLFLQSTSKYESHHQCTNKATVKATVKANKCTQHTHRHNFPSIIHTQTHKHKNRLEHWSSLESRL